jgi:Domain of unknown function (DUF4338)
MPELATKSSTGLRGRRGADERTDLRDQHGADERTDLRDRVLRSLEHQGFRLEDDGRLAPASQGKAAIRALHATARHASIERARDGLRRHEDRLLGRFAAGADLDVQAIRPRLVEVAAGSEEELLFRYARLHWSIPVSAGYGRRLRFLIVDEANDKLIGLFGLGDPVFAIGPRERWIGWDWDARKARLRHVMDAFLLGAVPPYSSLMCGKLVAMLMTSSEVRRAFKRKYGGSDSLITNRPFDGNLALITTTSALGRSSIYNRVRVGDRRLLQSVGFTSGSGEFHFANGIYRDLIGYADANLQPTAKHIRWGGGWRNRREVVRRTLPELGLSSEMIYHGVQRELFVAPLAPNTREFLCGQHKHLRPYKAPAAALFDAFRARWLLPRAERDRRYRDFDPNSLRIWTGTR